MNVNVFKTRHSKSKPVKILRDVYISFDNNTFCVFDNGHFCLFRMGEARVETISSHLIQVCGFVNNGDEFEYREAFCMFP